LGGEPCDRDGALRDRIRIAIRAQQRRRDQRAAKEAFAKALGTGVRAPATLQNIGVSHDALGKPVLTLAPALQALVEEKHIAHQHLSISDEKALAVAFVVLEI
jgi:holo-[acyl-carrier protein] synthase